MYLCAASKRVSGSISSLMLMPAKASALLGRIDFASSLRRFQAGVGVDFVADGDVAQGLGALGLD